MTGQNILQAGFVKEAIRIMYPFSGKDTTEVKEVLKQLGVFDYRTVDALLATGSTDQVLHLIEETAKEVNRFSQLFTDDKKHQLKWGENIAKMKRNLEPMFHSWFGEAELEVKQYELKSQFEHKVKSTVEQVKRSVTALMNSEEEVAKAISSIAEAFTAIKEAIQQSNLRDDWKNELVSTIITRSQQESFDFVKQKFNEKPVHILYYRSGSRVAVKLNFNKEDKSCRYDTGRSREVRWNKGEDRDEFPLIVSASYIEDFLYTNKVRDEDILVDERSVDQFYQFDNNISVNLTPAFIASWYNYDCPYIYRITPNKNGGTNMLGMPICQFSNRLVESSWSAIYIDEDITEKEAQAFIKGHENSGIAEEIQNVLRARKIQEAGKIEEVEKYVNEYDAKIQKVIDENEAVILKGIASAFPKRVYQATGTDGETVFRLNDNFGLDCGFLNVYSHDKVYQESRSILKNATKASPWMNVKMPYQTQSTTVQKAQFDVVKELVIKKLGIQLYGNVLLD